MGIILQKNQTNSDLHERIRSDLREKASTTSKKDGAKDPDFIDDSEYIKGLKQTGRFTWVWFVLIILAIISLIIIFVI
jgi:hypothetical protein